MIIRYQYPLPPARHQPHLLTPSAQTINQAKKTKNPEIRSDSQQIVSYCLGLRTQNPGLKEVDLEPSPMRGSDKIKMLKHEPCILKSLATKLHTNQPS